MGVGLIVAAGAWLLVLSGYDIAERRLPNWLTLPGAVVVPVVAGFAGRGVPALAGAAALSVLYLAVHLLSPGAMGGGDVKLAFGLGAMTGAFGVDVWLLAALAAPLVSAVLALGAALRGIRSVPHGPSMCAASAAAVAVALA
ncbi:peptidase A24 [Mycolicibacterium fortuitum]|uniref:prepilin peptidase n=1 Tax=Mycolicibacterium fortuitum TaxID=1766 RepID=UPI0007ED9974|nr:A24 family peptidase [Mycolicibacterium fortuitum]OBI62921.1 peptidase A24 [Mycolicibacterium fortuitum]OMC05665.1 peptidase A24 [Mycolicibacterium fortuitum]